MAQTSNCGTVHLLDYGAGNVRSVRNALLKLGYTVVDVERPDQIAAAERLVFPGVGAFGSAVAFLDEKGFTAPLRAYVEAGRPFLGICLGFQILFEGSEESPGAKGLGLIPGQIERFKTPGLSVPHIGWNGLRPAQAGSRALDGFAPARDRVYFVHSYRAGVGRCACGDWALTTSGYGGERFVSAVQRGAVVATQFHPEKSGAVGLRVFRNVLEMQARRLAAAADASPLPPQPPAAKKARVDTAGGNGNGNGNGAGAGAGDDDMASFAAAAAAAAANPNFEEPAAKRQKIEGNLAAEC